MDASLLVLSNTFKLWNVTTPSLAILRQLQNSLVVWNGVGGFAFKMCGGDFNEVESFVAEKLRVDPKLICDSLRYHRSIFTTFY